MKTWARLGLFCAVAGLVQAGSPGAARGAGPPMQPWVSKDGNVRLLHPSSLAPLPRLDALNTLMAPGWRLLWDSATRTGPGHVVVAFAIKVKPTSKTEKTGVEALQVSESNDPAVVATCLSYGLTASANRPPDQVIDGLTFTTYGNGDAGMSQHIGAVDLRAVRNGVCYAVERIHAGESASGGDPMATLPERQGAAELDAIMNSLQFGNAQ